MNGSPTDYLREMLALANKMFKYSPSFSPVSSCVRAPPRRKLFLQRPRSRIFVFSTWTSERRQKTMKGVGGKGQGKPGRGKGKGSGAGAGSTYADPGRPKSFHAHGHRWFLILTIHRTATGKRRRRRRRRRSRRLPSITRHGKNPGDRRRSVS